MNGLWRAGVQAAFALSWAVVALSALAGAAGLLWPALYEDPELFIRAGWLGNDWVTLLVLVPLLGWSTWSAARGSAVGALVWLGALDAALYNFAFYVFGAAPNRLLVVYIALVAASLLAMLVGLVNLRAEAFPATGPRTRRIVAGYMLAWALLLALLWTVQAGSLAVTGQPPDLNGSTHAFRVTAALDLILVVPFVALAGVLLLRHRAWGLPAAVILNVKGIVYPVVLLASSGTAHLAGVPDALTLTPLWLAFLAASSASCWFLLAPVRQAAA